MPLRNCILLFATGCLLIGGTSLAAETATLDPPALDPGVEATTLLHLDVQAGVSGAPNGFTIQWMPRTLFDAKGGWPADGDPSIQYAIFLGSPTLNTQDNTRSFLLGPGETATVELGDLFDETGVLASVSGEMATGTEYVVRVGANGDGGLPSGGNSLVGGSGYSSTYYAWTKSNQGTNDCVHSQGYWKTHPEAWPVSQLRLGNIIYTKPQLQQIWATAANGNGLVSLAHQLMAAKLNVISGAIPPSSVTGTISTADALIGSRIVPSVGSGFLSPGTTSSLTDTLEGFNTEQSDVQCQQTTSARSATWGQLKAIYR